MAYSNKASAPDSGGSDTTTVSMDHSASGLTLSWMTADKSGNDFTGPDTGGTVTVSDSYADTGTDPETVASQTASGAHCKPGTVTKKASSTVPKGDVISSSPAAGATLAAGSTVHLTVSKGSKKPPVAKVSCKVPSLKGKLLAKAKSALRKAHCAVGTVTKKASSTVAKGHVISSSPGAGAKRPKGTKVNLTVSSGKKKPPVAKVSCKVPSLKGKLLAKAKSALKKAHCAVGTVTKKASSTVAKGHVISSSPGAGAKRPKGTKVNLTVSSGKNLKPRSCINLLPTTDFAELPGPPGVPAGWITYTPLTEVLAPYRGECNIQYTVTVNEPIQVSPTTVLAGIDTLLTFSSDTAAHQVLEKFVSVTGGVQPVAGIGDEAYIGTDHGAVRVGNDVFNVVWETGMPPGVTVEGVLKDVVKTLDH
jgi:beta-lactam-binding protein with PASTA domain